MHQVSVIGDTEDILANLNLPCDIKLETGENKVVFISENIKAIKSTKETLSKVISEIIYKKYNDKFIDYVIKREGFLSDDAIFLMNAREGEGKKIIKNELLKYFSCNNVISIEGFRKFRLRRYEAFFKKCISEYDDAYEAVKETEDLLCLLRIYIESRPKLESEVQIFPQKHGGYILKNNKDIDITEKCIKEFINFERFSEMSFDDILLSCLIVISPGKIIIHSPENIRSQELIVVLQKIFRNKVFLSKECN